MQEMGILDLRSISMPLLGLAHGFLLGVSLLYLASSIFCDAMSDRP